MKKRSGRMRHEEPPNDESPNREGIPPSEDGNPSYEMDEYVRAALSSDQDAVFIYNLERGTIVDVNQRLCELFGYTREEALHHLADHFRIESRIGELVQRISEGVPERVEWQVLDKSGRRFWVEANIRGIAVQGQKHLLLVVRDITGQKQTLGEWEHFFEHSPDLLCIAGFQGYLLRTNPAWTRTLGWSEAELLSRPWAEFVHPEDRSVSISVNRNLRTGGIVTDFRNRFLCKDGSYRWLSWSSVPLIEEDRMLFVARDISEHKRAEEALRQSEERYRELVQNTNSIILRWDRQGRVRFLNEFGQSFFGYSADEILGRSVIGTIVPETETSGRDLVKLMDEICRNPQNYESNINENIRKDGERVWVAWTNKPVIDENGELVEILSVGVDFTERKKSIESMQLLTDVVRNMQVGLYVYHLENPGDDHSLRLTAVNPASTTELGLTEDRIIGRYIDEVFPRLREFGIAQRFAEVVRTGQSFNMEGFAYKDPALSLRYYSFKAFQVPGNQVAVLFDDITSMKRLEEEKREFYRQTILSATDGKLVISDRSDVKPYLANAQLAIKVVNPADLSSARHAIEDFCAQHGLQEERAADYVLAVGEAITNALKHSGGGVTYAGASDVTIWVAVADKGGGIGSLILPKAILRRGYSTKPSLGLGYSIMLDVADQILLETGKEGTIVVLIINLSAREEITLESIPDTWSGIPSLA